MKKLLLVGVGSALMFTMGGVGPAAADAGPHTSTQVAAGDTALVSVAGGGRCASCHRAHTAKAEYLLKDSQPALCYTCHGGSAASLDVIDGVNNDNGGALRGGGFEYSMVNGATATKTMGAAPVPDPITGITPRQAHSASDPVGIVPAVVTSRHQIDGTTTGTMWGNGAVSATVNPGKPGVTLECGSCHDPHGNGNYRILKPIPNDSGAAVAVNIPDAVTTVAQPEKVYTTADYWLVGDASVPLVKGGVAPAAGTPDGYVSNVAAWCTTCHTRYLAGSGSGNAALKDGAGVTDALFTYRHRSDKGSANSPNCIQCHVSHGTSANMTSRAASFTAPDGTTPVTTTSPATPYTDHAGVAKTGVSKSVDNTSRLLRVDNRGTCVMCHNV